MNAPIDAWQAGILVVLAYVCGWCSGALHEVKRYGRLLRGLPGKEPT